MIGARKTRRDIPPFFIAHKERRLLALRQNVILAQFRRLWHVVVLNGFPRSA
jgi:hypothetical protein